MLGRKWSWHIDLPLPFMSPSTWESDAINTRRSVERKSTRSRGKESSKMTPGRAPRFAISRQSWCPLSSNSSHRRGVCDRLQIHRETFWYRSTAWEALFVTSCQALLISYSKKHRCMPRRVHNSGLSTMFWKMLRCANGWYLPFFILSAVDLSYWARTADLRSSYLLVSNRKRFQLTIDPPLASQKAHKQLINHGWLA